MLSKKYKLHENARHRRLDGKSVIIHQSNNEVLGLNETGSAVMEAILNGQPLLDVVDNLVKTYQCTKEQATSDVEALIGNLLSSQIILEEAA